MEKAIKKLNELALGYVDYGIGVGLPDSHNTITDLHKMEGFDLRVNVYFNNSAETWAISLGNVEVTGYSKKVSIPIDSTSDSLELTYSKCKKYLDYLIENVAKVKYSSLKERAKKIQQLRNEIDKLRRY